MDLSLILVHHLLHAFANNLPHTIQVMMEGCSRNNAVIYIIEVAQQYDAIIPNLLGACALSGCDTVSSLAGIGKQLYLTD